MPTEDDKYSRIDYRRLIAWPERIRREATLLEEVLGSGPSQRILDLGSGTGEHARYLVSQGYQVVGVDASESMIDKARDVALPPGLEFHHADIREIEGLVGGSFGGAICLGNTLPHLKEPGDLERLFKGLRSLLEPTAALLLQVLNYHRILTQQVRHLPVNFRQDEEGEIVFLRLMEPQSDGGVLFFPLPCDFVRGRTPRWRSSPSRRSTSEAGDTPRSNPRSTSVDSASALCWEASMAAPSSRTILQI